MTATILGNQGSVQKHTRKFWTFFDGERQQIEITGPRTTVDAIYQNYKTVAGFNPEYDSLDFDPRSGYSRLLINKIEDGENLYELYGNDLMKQPQQHPYFYNALTTTEIQTVFQSFDAGSTEGSCGFTAKQLELYRHLAFDVQLPLSAYVLRSTLTTSKRSTRSASYDNVNTVVDPPDVSAINSLIGEVPSGEWLKKTPMVRRVGPRRWEISQEWWWAEAWSVALGGTWLKYVAP